MAKGAAYAAPLSSIGVSGLEPLASWPPSRHSTKLSYTPEQAVGYRSPGGMSPPVRSRRATGGGSA